MNDLADIELNASAWKRLKWRLIDMRYLCLGLVSHWLLLDRKSPETEQLKTFCCFVGHGRSGGTLVGALLNAHPNVVMSNELHALRRLRTGMTARQLYRLIYLKSRRQVQRGSIGGGGYSYAISGQWQGRHRELMVIGDRKAGATAHEIVSNPGVLEILNRKVGLEKKFIHVIRNPFDTITTTYHKTLPKRGEDADGHLSREIQNYFARSTAVRRIETVFGATAVYHLHHELLLADPIGQLRVLCDFLGIEPFADYLQDCASILTSSPHQSRKLLQWTSHQVDAVMLGIEQCPWLNGYSLDP
jgi:hypothetical protein